MPICLPRWNEFRECSGSSHGREENRFTMSDYPECYACTQVGVPAFHSSRCDTTRQRPHLEAAAGSSLMPITTGPESNAYSGRANGKKKKRGFGFSFGQVLDPRSRYVQRWNRAVLLARATALAVDPLFFYVVTLSGNGFPCFYMDRLAYVSSESLVVGCGKLVWDPRAIAMHNLRSLNKFWLDAFVILPIPQVIIWFVVPKLLEGERIKQTMTILLVGYLFQSLPNFYHSIYLMRRLKKVTGYIFGSVWWRFNLNVLAYLIVSHVAGGCWYILAMRRTPDFCKQFSGCQNPLSNLLGLLNLSSFGNELVPTSHWLEVLFSICITLGGLALFVTLIGNIQICLHAVMASKKRMQIRCRDLEWWMKRRQLPSHLRQRVRNFERQNWMSMGGQDEMQLIQDLPDGLRKDIKRYLCIDLIRKVPIFQMLDDIILDNICDMLRPVVYSQGEKGPRRARSQSVPGPARGDPLSPREQLEQSTDSRRVRDWDPRAQPSEPILFRGYGSILPTSLAYIVPSTRGCSPWRPDAVMSTTGRDRHSVLRIFKGRRGRTGHHATCGALPAAGPYLRLSRFQGGQAVKQKR
ncbi:hypothetical protein L6164_037942 [Bauhinia variegata]|nr:hypothetical protein L6164_037942 [Bauhinia variegata]